MSEELSEDGYRTGPEAAFEGPSAWQDVDQEEVSRLRSSGGSVFELALAHLARMVQLDAVSGLRTR